jgi:hypothetical protein
MHRGYALKGERFETVEAVWQGSLIDCLSSCIPREQQQNPGCQEEMK